MNEEYGMLQLLELCRDIEKNPSQLHSNGKHKNAPQTPDFDWNVFVNRIDHMMEKDRIQNNPIRQCRLAISALNADLTYNNRNRAKKHLKNVVDKLEREEISRKKWAAHEQEQQEDLEKGLKVSTFLTDEFWENIVNPQEPDIKSKEEVPIGVLNEEKHRYQRLIGQSVLRL